MCPSILYSDNHLVAVNKPAGWVTHEDGVHLTTLRSWVEDWIVAHYQKPGRAFVVPVHRLDRLTSGVVLFAKSDKALRRTMEAFRQREVQKVYLVETEEKSGVQEGLWQDWIVREWEGSRLVEAGYPKSQSAQMRVELLSSTRGRCRWRVELLTGRHHQIRVQFAARGLPIIGDERYGSTQTCRRGILLHHLQLQLCHPTLQVPLTLLAPLPSSWSELA